MQSHTVQYAYDGEDYRICKTVSDAAGTKETKGVIGALVGGGIEYINQRFVEKRKEIDWKAVVYEAAQGFVTDLGQQVIVEEKKASEINAGQAVKTMAIAGIGGILGAVTDYAADRFRNARTKYVPMEVEVEKVKYECFNHVINCKNHENDIRVVTKEKEWRMVGIPEFGGSDRMVQEEQHKRPHIQQSILLLKYLN